MRIAEITLTVCGAILPAGCGGGPRPDGPTAKAATSSSGVPLVLIPAGAFEMGCDTGKPDEGPVHRVTVSAFAMDRYEVTQDQLRALEIPNSSHFKDPQRPAEQFRWSDAAMFCNERSKKEGLAPCYDEATLACNFQATGYRLPTEAEWEYAARAGSTADYCYGGDPRRLASYACYAEGSDKKTDLVGKRKPNAWGLYDMHGNVMEWCHDVYAPDYYTRSPSSDPHGPEKGEKRVLRGGAWNSPAERCRTSVRVGAMPGISDSCFAKDTYGFRCVRKLTAEEAALLNGSNGPAQPEE